MSWSSQPDPNPEIAGDRRKPAHSLRRFTESALASGLAPACYTTPRDTTLLTGDANDNMLVGGARADNLFGGAGNDRLIGGGGEDLLVGGEGDDFLNGGGHADKYQFSFTLTEGEGTTSLFAPLDNDPADGQITQDEFIQQYNAWLTSLGTDTNADTDIDIDPQQNSSTVAPTVEGYDGVFGAKVELILNTNVGGPPNQSRWYSPSATTEGQDTVTSNDGHDTIVGFNWNEDKLEFKGLVGISETEFDSFFDVVEGDFDLDGTQDSRVQLADESWSVTLLGVSGHTIGEFYNDVSLFTA